MKAKVSRLASALFHPVPSGRKGLLDQLRIAWRDYRATVRWTAADLTDRMIFNPFVERLAMRISRRGTRQPAGLPRRLYIDLSVITKSDAGTGIQRVVRSIAQHLPAVCDPALEIAPLVIQRHRDGYRTADEGKALQPAGAIFLALDFATDSIHRHRRELDRLSRSGMQVWVVVHDVLPLSHPDWFTAANRIKYRRWLRVCARLADGFICFSDFVAVELGEMLHQRYGVESLPPIVTVDPGTDIQLTSGQPIPVTATDIPGIDQRLLRQAVLLVATLEPRKGHADVLDAFELLWSGAVTSKPEPLPLVLIGRRGWNVESLIERIRTHPQFGKLLFWSDRVQDEALHQAYLDCKLAIVPSLAEGYGLPLDEALARGAPVLARDITVFRRHRNAAIRHFAVDATPAELAQMIMESASANRVPNVAPVMQRWEQTAAQIAQAIGVGLRA